MRLAAVVLALSLFAGVDARAEEVDPPGVAGRIAHVEGAVALQTGEPPQWSPAPLNYPVTSGMALWTPPQARAELELPGATVRLDGETELAIVTLNDSETRLRLVQGNMNLVVHSVDNGPLLVETPKGVVEVVRAGVYRVTAGADMVQVAVLDGAARFDGERDFIDLNTGDAVEAIGEPAALNSMAARRTPFDDWALAREQPGQPSQTAQYVSPDVPGHRALDRAGTWAQEPQYGPVWYPQAVPVEWAPYRHGHWAWVAPWGWTWIDDQPWGFAPFHYGRWVQIGQRWAWRPDDRRARPVYAPALVVFIGNNFHLGHGGGHAGNRHRVPAVGWVPLAPREAYRPPYRSSAHYVRRVNHVTVNNIAINNIEVNRPAREFRNFRAATVVPASAMRNAMAVAPEARRVHGDAIGALNEARADNAIGGLRPTPAARAGVQVGRGGDARAGGNTGRPLANTPSAVPVAPAPPPRAASVVARTPIGPVNVTPFPAARAAREPRDEARPQRPRPVERAATPPLSPIAPAAAAPQAPRSGPVPRLERPIAVPNATVPVMRPAERHEPRRDDRQVTTPPMPSPAIAPPQRTTPMPRFERPVAIPDAGPREQPMRRREARQVTTPAAPAMQPATPMPRREERQAVTPPQASPAAPQVHRAPPMPRPAVMTPQPAPQAAAPAPVPQAPAARPERPQRGGRPPCPDGKCGG